MAKESKNGAEPLGFSISGAALNSLRNMGDKRAHFLLTGDLHSMGVMKDFLQRQGIRVVNSGVYPGFEEDREKDYIKALRLLFENRVDGWFSQESALIEKGICTQAEFRSAVEERVSASRRRCDNL